MTSEERNELLSNVPTVPKIVINNELTCNDGTELLEYGLSCERLNTRNDGLDADGEQNFDRCWVTEGTPACDCFPYHSRNTIDGYLGICCKSKCYEDEYLDSEGNCQYNKFNSRIPATNCPLFSTWSE